MADVRRILVIFVIATLFSIFVFTSIDAFYPSPDYSDYCEEDKFDQPKPYKPRPDNYTCPDVEFNEQAMKECRDRGGEIRYEQNEYSCNINWTCSMCQKNYNEAREQHNLWRFIISAILGLIAITIGLVLPEEKTMNEWVGSGLMLGGLITIFVGTAMSFGDLHRWIRPIIILFELLLVIFLAYKKMSK